MGVVVIIGFYTQKLSTLVYAINIAHHVQEELTTTYVTEIGMRALQLWKQTLL